MIVSILMKVENCDFNFLKQLTQTTQGNLSIQLKKLNECGYISINKSFEKTITYHVDESHSATLTNEKNSIEYLSEKIAEDIINFLYIYFEA